MTLYRLAALLLGCFAARGDIVGVDLGTEFMKLALIKPGKGMEIVTNVETKRKTPTRVAVAGDELIFGSNAVALEGRHPENTFPQLGAMLGRSAEDARVRQLNELTRSEWASKGFHIGSICIEAAAIGSAVAC